MALRSETDITGDERRDSSDSNGLDVREKARHSANQVVG